MSSTMKNILKVAAVGLLALALVAVFAACSNSSSGSKDDAATGDNADVVEHVDDGDTVEASLAEWSIKPASGEGFEASAGDVEFEVHNEGAVPHELVILKTDLAADALAVTDGKVDEHGDGVEEIGEVEEFPGGETEVGTFHLEPGRYLLICNVAGHYQQGMTAELIVQ